MKITHFIFILWSSVLLGACIPRIAGEVVDQPLVAQTPALPTPIPVGKPVQLSIPALGVQSQVEWVGLTEEKRMDVPSDWWNVGWYALGVKPGEQGKAVIAGHFDSPSGPAVFAALRMLQLGEVIEVTDEWGDRYIFIVVSRQSYSDETFPIEEVFGPSEERILNLITCEGVYDQVQKNYSERLVVSALLKE
jgi:sortase A